METKREERDGASKVVRLESGPSVALSAPAQGKRRCEKASRTTFMTFYRLRIIMEALPRIIWTRRRRRRFVLLSKSSLSSSPSSPAAEERFSTAPPIYLLRLLPKKISPRSCSLPFYIPACFIFATFCTPYLFVSLLSV